MLPEMSVVMACRNAASVIADQLAALARQECDRDWELVVADNGSRDQTAAIVASFTGRLPGLRVVDAGTRPGKSFALEAGTSAASADLLVFVDADDEVAPGFLAAMARGLDEHDVVAARLEDRKLNPEWLTQFKQAARGGPVTRYGFLPGAAGCGLGIRRAAYEAVGGVQHDVGVADDIDLCWRLHLAGFPLVFVPDAVVHYRYRATLRTIYRQAVGYGEAGPLLYRKYRDVGMPRTSARSVARTWAGTLSLVLRATSKRHRCQAAEAVGLRVGKVRSSVRNRVLYL